MLAVDDWIYITEKTDKCWDLHPQLFNTRKEAEKAASTTWKHRATKIVKYN